MLPTDNILPGATLVGRVWRPDVDGASLVVLRGDRVVDITCREVPTMRDLFERDNIPGYLEQARGDDLGSLAEIAANSTEKAPRDKVHFLSPALYERLMSRSVRRELE